MAPSDLHNRVLAQAARKALTPLGVRQRGRSRVWLDDHGWWLGIAEFQPSSWAKGTYLNVGAMWLWRVSDSLSFDYGYRAESFQECHDSETFARVAEGLAIRAGAELQRLREQLSNAEAVAKAVAERPAESEWNRYHAGIANALAGNASAARAYLESLVREEGGKSDWQRELAHLAQDLVILLDQPGSLHSWADDTIRGTRAALRLPAWDGTVATQQRVAAS